MKWEEFKNRSPRYLNLGGGGNNHNEERYKNYVSVQIPEGVYQHKSVGQTANGIGLVDFERPTLGRAESYTIYHDIQDPFPIEGEVVDRILSEDCIEHIEEKFYEGIFSETYRILKPGGIFRLSAPDYMHPQNKFCLSRGFDPRDLMHVTLTTYNLLKKYADSFPFKNVTWQHYWKDDEFIYNEIDYSMGYIKRTPDNDWRSKLKVIRDGEKITETKFMHTSIVVDLIK